MKKIRRTRLIALLACASVTFAATAVFALGGDSDTAFTYQGRLLDAGEPANGTFNLDFSLFDALRGGNQIGLEVMFNDHPVVDGLFTLELDFGASAFDNTSRWIEISVNGSELSPRQPLTRSPYSIQTRGIFVDEDNNVGIGTSTPLYPLHVESDGDYSIFAQNEDSSGRGVVGVATANTGSTYGGSFESWSTSGRGVFGLTTASTGLTDGVFGQSNSTSGRGICGWAPALTGTTYGVYGTSDSTDGAGVSGDARATTGATYGVFGTSDSTDGAGVYGHANAATGFTYGGRFESESTSGSGVRGTALANTGSLAWGVEGVSHSTTGRGVFGTATASDGITYGVYGLSDSFDGFDFFAGGAGEDYGSASSRRWKSNIRNIDDPLSKIAQLRGVYFDWDTEHGGHHDVGMIAEEVGEVIPEIVQYEENGIDAIGMDYSKMTPLLVEAVNALHNEVEYKDAQITELQDRLAALETLVDRLVLNQNGGAE